MIDINKIYLGDCLDVMKFIGDKSIDMILCDLPYGITQNKWDTIIPFKDLWYFYERIIKDNGAIVLFGQDKFSAKLMLSNEKIHRYNLIWDKQLTSGFLNANKMPLRCHEDIIVFYKQLPIYNPQKIKGNKNHSKGKMQTEISNNNYSKYKRVDMGEILGDMKHPKSIISFSKPHPSKCLHPTQKPIELCEWLIQTYTNEEDLILDNCIGSGTTAIAAINTNRRWIGIEKDEKYFETANKRIEEHYKTMKKKLF